jgi:hypothetical protein
LPVPADERFAGVTGDDDVGLDGLGPDGLELDDLGLDGMGSPVGLSEESLCGGSRTSHRWRISEEPR